MKSQGSTLFWIDLCMKGKIFCTICPNRAKDFSKAHSSNGLSNAFKENDKIMEAWLLYAKNILQFTTWLHIAKKDGSRGKCQLGKQTDLLSTDLLEQMN